MHHITMSRVIFKISLSTKYSFCVCNLSCAVTITHPLATLLGTMFSCFLSQMPIQPITWQPLCTFRHEMRQLAKVQTEQEMGRNGTEVILNRVNTVVGVIRLQVPTGIFTTSQPSLGFTENAPKERKYPVGGGSVEKNAACVSGVRMSRLVGSHRKERGSQTVTLVTTEICRVASLNAQQNYI